ncbi:MAG TPA: hypothetical protein VIY73_15230, partial [Polyangiaceae bacterium]
PLLGMNAPSRLAWLAVPALVLCSRPARAGSADADAAFREGRKALQAGNLAAACAHFEESERLEPAPGTLLNLADCEERSGKLAHAKEHFGVAASGFPRGDVRRGIAMQHIAAIEKRLARFTLRLAASAPPGTVVRDGEDVVEKGDLGTARTVDPGVHVVVVTAPGRADRSYDVTLHEGDQVEQTIDAGAPSAAATAPPVPAPASTAPVATVETPPPSPSSGKGVRTTGFVLGGIGVAGIATGAVTGILALGRASTVKSHCPGDACDPQGLDAASQGKWLAPTSTVAFIAGGAFLAAGAYLVFFRGHASANVVLAPTAAAGAAGAIVRATF